MFTPLEITRQKAKNREKESLTGFKFLVIQGINIYQKTSSFIREGLGLPKTICRFHPNCSEYSKQVIEKYGLLKGGFKGLKRILKCNPWCNGGIDLP